jgi:hypothetical protein
MTNPLLRRTADTGYLMIVDGSGHCPAKRPGLAGWFLRRRKGSLNCTFIRGGVGRPVRQEEERTNLQPIAPVETC